MFKPTSAKDRINYGEVLMPPVGFHLEKAIGTSYSLDLETLTAVSISLGLIEDTDSELISNPISMLNALQKVSDRITVFCEAGQIKMPAKANALCLMLEKMVVPVKLPYDKKINRYPAFHPKMWLLEYANQDGVKSYRFVVMSRNMTFDHSWDIACSMEGSVTSEPAEKSQPIIDFLLFLKKQLNRELANYRRQSKDLSYFTKALEYIKFVTDERFSNYSIYPLGIGTAGYKMADDALFTENFHELVVMSPFLTGSVIAELNKDWKTLTGTSRVLITRRSELPKIADMQASNFDVYVMKDDIVDGEDAISDGENASDDEPSKQDIHAKIFIRKKYNAVDLYLGSMNASFAAINSNIELVLKLQTKNSVLNGDKFLDDIMGEDRDQKKNPFELVTPEKTAIQDTTSAQDKVEQIIKKICRFKMSAVAVPCEDRYDVKLTVGIDDKLDGVRIRPLSSNKESELLPEIEFLSLGILQLSEFYVLSVTVDDCTLERVIMIPTSGLPEGRETEIVKSVVKDKKSFIEYVAFVLGDDYVQSFLENKKSTGASGEWDAGNAMPAVYEKMLKTSLSDPGRLSEIQYITRIVEEEDIIPPEFREMYQVFCDTLGIK